MTTQPTDPEGNQDADLDGPGADLTAATDDDAESGEGDALGIDDNDPIDAELVGKPVDRDDDEDR